MTVRFVGFAESHHHLAQVLDIVQRHRLRDHGIWCVRCLGATAEPHDLRFNRLQDRGQFRRGRVLRDELQERRRIYLGGELARFLGPLVGVPILAFHELRARAQGIIHHVSDNPLRGRYGPAFIEEPVQVLREVHVLLGTVLAQRLAGCAA